MLIHVSGQGHDIIALDQVAGADKPDKTKRT